LQFFRVERASEGKIIFFPSKKKETFLCPFFHSRPASATLFSLLGAHTRGERRKAGKSHVVVPVDAGLAAKVKREREGEAARESANALVEASSSF